MSDLIDRREKEQKGKCPYEVYRLTLTHYIDADGTKIQIEEPLVVAMAYDRRYGNVPIILNRMIDMMRGEMLRRATND